MDKVIGQVYETTDYDSFRFMKENRSVDKSREKKIRKSIEENGWIINPIQTNEKKEIIDGQGRFTVLREKGLPVQYIVINGAGPRECIVLNTSNSTWSLSDYIESYMEQGNKSYGFLWHLCNEFREYGITTAEIIFAVNGTIDSQNNIIKKGKFTCTEDQMEMAETLLNYRKQFLPVELPANKGNRKLIGIAIMFVRRMELCEPEKLLDKFNRYFASDMVPVFTKIDGALKDLNVVYNYKATNKVHFEIEYEKYMAGKYGWYTTKWGSGGNGIAD